jgi:hypothetical protein
MARLLLFFLLGFVVEMVILGAVYRTIADGSPWVLIAGLAFFGSVVALAASLAAAIVQRIAGRLSSFSAAASGAVGLAVLSELLLGYMPGSTLGGGAIMLLGYFVAIQCLWRIPVLRRLVDPASTRGSFKSLSGTVSFFKEPAVTLETAVANRSGASWRWSQRGTARPSEWRDISIGEPPRRVAPSLATLTLCGRRMTSGWIAFGLGALAFAGWLRLDAIQRVKLHGKVATAAIADWICKPAAFSVIDWLRYRRLGDQWSVVHYAFVADGRRIELRSSLWYGCPTVPRESLTYARRDPTVTDVSNAEEVGLLVVGMPLVALALLRFGFLRIREGFLAVHLLRTGHLVSARRENVSLPGSPPAAIASAEVNGKRILVITPAPLVLGDRQNLLVDRELRTIAWDLLPFVPRMDARGAFVVPSMRDALPGALAPVVALFAIVVPLIAW